MAGLLDVAKAKKEIAAKEMLQIERDTALTWGARAAASYDNARVVEDIHGRLQCFWEAETYRAEALEHAAMTEDVGFLETVRTEIEAYRARARDALEAERAGTRRPNRPKAETEANSSGRPMAASTRPAKP
jgi:hypothetical protein